MQENERNRTTNAGQESGAPQTGGGTIGGRRHDGELERQDEWSRRQRYGAFYTNASERFRQRQGSWQSRRGTQQESERGGWSGAPGRFGYGQQGAYGQGGYQGGYEQGGYFDGPRRIRCGDYCLPAKRSEIRNCVE